MCNTVATTQAGLACQIRMGLGVFGEKRREGGDWDDPAEYKFANWADDLDGRLYRNMLVAAERLVGVVP